MAVLASGFVLMASEPVLVLRVCRIRLVEDPGFQCCSAEGRF